MIKNGKFKPISDLTREYDSIDFSNYRTTLITEKNKLKGIYGIVEPKYISIDNFHFFLARVVKPNGQISYIDYKGREY